MRSSIRQGVYAATAMQSILCAGPKLFPSLRKVQVEVRCGVEGSELREVRVRLGGVSGWGSK